MWQLLERIGEVVKPFGVQLLAEVHEDFKLNIKLARCEGHVCVFMDCAGLAQCACSSGYDTQL